MTKRELLDRCAHDGEERVLLARALDLPEQEEVLMLLDLGYAAPGFQPLPNHGKRKELSETVTYL